MKAIFASLVAALLISTTAAPTFAATSGDNCSFKDKTLCVTESLVSYNNS